jgi:hypothetical protein
MPGASIGNKNASTFISHHKNSLVQAYGWYCTKDYMTQQAHGLNIKECTNLWMFAYDCDMSKNQYLINVTLCGGFKLRMYWYKVIDFPEF